MIVLHIDLLISLELADVATFVELCVATLQIYVAYRSRTSEIEKHHYATPKRTRCK